MGDFSRASVATGQRRRPRPGRRPGGVLRRSAGRWLRRRGRANLARGQTPCSRRCRAAVRALGILVGEADCHLPARCRGGGIARRLPGGRRAGAADAGGARAGHGLRPARRLQASARDRGRGTLGTRHGAGGDGLRLGTGSRSGVRAGSGADHRGRSRGTDLEPVLACLTMADKAEPSAEEIIRYDKDAEDPHRHHHVRATGLPQRADYRRAPALRRSVAPSGYRRRRQGAGGPRSR